MSEFQGCNDCFQINSAKSFVDCELMFNFADEPSVHAVEGGSRHFEKGRLRTLSSTVKLHNFEQSGRYGNGSVHFGRLLHPVYGHETSLCHLNRLVILNEVKNLTP